MEDIIQLKITLKWSKPPIWRRVLVDKKATFYDLHNIIQVAMGWWNYHLYEFNINGQEIGDPNDDFDFREIIDASTITLGSMITKPNQKFEYEYDFGDGWTHQIVAEKFLPRDSKIKYPTCIAGKLCCPPEDCGGMYGFYELLEIAGDKKHPDREEMLEWLSEDYDATYFDKEEVNQELKTMISQIKRMGE